MNYVKFDIKSKQAGCVTNEIDIVYTDQLVDVTKDDLTHMPFLSDDATENKKRGKKLVNVIQKIPADPAFKTMVGSHRKRSVSKPVLAHGIAGHSVKDIRALLVELETLSRVTRVSGVY